MQTIYGFVTKLSLLMFSMAGRLQQRQRQTFYKYTTYFINIYIYLINICT